MSDFNHNSYKEISSATLESGEYGESSQNTMNGESGAKFIKQRSVLKRNKSIDSQGKNVIDSQDEPFYRTNLAQGLPEGGFGELIPRFIGTAEAGARP